MADRIVINPQIHFGKPRVAGTRILVQHVLEIVDEGVSFERIVQDYYPELTIDDTHACMRYAIALVAADDMDQMPMEA